MNGSFYAIVAAVAVLVLWRRTRSMYRPIRGSGARLIVPLVFLLPGISMMVNPRVHAEVWQWAAALVLGALLSVPLIWTTNYEVREDGLIYARKNIGFIIAFLGVLAIRFLLRAELSEIDAETKAALFMIVACGYLIPWRIVSLVKFRNVLNRREQTNVA